LNDLTERVLLFGPGGNLGPFWVDALHSANKKILGLGSAQNLPAKTRMQLSAFQEFDLLNPDLELLSKLIQDFRPKEFVLNSGIDSPPGDGQSSPTSYSYESWHNMFQVNCLSLVILMNILQALDMSELRIVVIGSMYSQVSPNPKNYSHFNNGVGFIKHPGYGATKAALRNIVKQYSVIFAPRQIRINMLSPGVVNFGQDSEFLKKIVQNIPMFRPCEPKELIAALNFLLDPSNSYQTGEELILDGGYQLW
jgi:NAD(P)-dependent dehydrogenase (short-subunit alcohol dehydrogenase family)